MKQSTSTIKKSVPKPQLTIERIFSSAKNHPYTEIEWENRIAEITDAENKIIFKQTDIQVPAFFSELATKILASKYFYGDIDNGNDPYKGGREHSFKQVIDRVVKTITAWGIKDGYFDADNAKIFEEELTWLLVNQYGAFNSPVWFNLGLYQMYGVGKNSSKGNFYWDQDHEMILRANSQYEYPQCSACFIQHVDDDMESIMQLAHSEAMLFKFGSGSGTDLSTIRSTREKLSGGGKPSGPLSFLCVYDAVAGVVKSGGKTRRAAKMNTLRDWHPDIEEFIHAKQLEEKKAWALIEEGYNSSFNGEAYGSIKFQNENLSVRASDSFMEAAIKGEKFWTRRVTDGSNCEEKDAAYLLDKISEGTHICGDPGMQFDDTIHKWHTCKGSGRQNCTNPCSEYLFLDNSACNLASLNLMKFRKDDGVDAQRFAAATRIFIIAQDIIVDRSSYPTEAITYNSHWFRTLGLGYANLGALLMSYGYPYASPKGLGLAKAITATLTGVAYRTSAEIAASIAPFSGYHNAAHHGVSDPPETNNVASMNAVLQLHRDAINELDKDCPQTLKDFAAINWDIAIKLGKKHGFRNAQVTVLAPTGTIGFLMDCDTTGIEPAIGLVAYKTLAGGGLMTLPIRSIPLALENLNYESSTIKKILNHIKEYGTIESIKSNDKIIHSGIRDEDIAIFDSAFPSGMGRRSLPYMDHVKMMAAVQPFLSGAISKTVNMPKETTVEEIRKTYVEAWRMGVKGIAIYRDGSKRSAPIKTRIETEKTKPEIQITTEPYRRKLSDTRSSLTHKFSIGNTEGYLTIGKFEDGKAGEVFIQMAKAGSTINWLMDCVGTLISLCLQYGVPLETLVKKFSHVRFEPEGMTKNPHIPFAKSVIDYVARLLGMEFIQGYKEKMSPLAVDDDAFEDQHPGSSTITKQETIKMDPAQLEFLTQSEGNLTCTECGSGKVKVTGTCACCLNCGTSLGCS
jgi:ribonucleoside-diphosphate reductase alpha chain